MKFPLYQNLISATLEGLSLARDEFTTLTGSDDWGEWIDYPEYMVGSCIMRHIKSRVPQVRVWPEVAPRFVSSAKDIRQGRIDIVIDDENDTPITVIEVKANIGLEKDFEAKGVKEDIERLCAILNAPLSAKLSLGLFAFIANRDDTLLGKTLPNIEKLCAEVARAKGLKLQAYSKKLERSDKKWEAYAIVYAITKE